MKISREKLLSESQTLGFRPEILEKVIHLLDLLEGLNSHPYLQDKWVLKGGTALNLFLFDTPRLSVDIDLNYIGASDIETMQTERPKIEEAVQRVCSRKEISIVRKPKEHAGGSWRLRYDGSLHEEGNLKVDLNFLFRVPLWPIQKHDAHIGIHSARQIPVLDLHELAAGKLAALLARHASRDLFDAHHLLTTTVLDPAKLRLGFVLYGAMNRVDWRTVSVDHVGYDSHEVENELIPVVRNAFIPHQGTQEWIHQMIAECREQLNRVLPLSENEIEFLDRLLDHGQLEPSLITSDPEMTERILVHPSLRWKALNVQKHKGLQG